MRNKNIRSLGDKLGDFFFDKILFPIGISLPVVVPLLIVGGAVGSAIYFGDIKPKNDLNNTYNQALVRYADKDADGNVTSTEREAFDTRFVQNMGINKIGYEFVYPDGRTISTRELAKMFESYNPQRELE